VPSGARRRIADAIPRPLALELTARLELRGYDWSRTRAFAHPADNQGYIRFNQQGRELHGIVPLAETATLAEEIDRGLRSFRDPDGAPALAAVEHVGDSYGGAEADRLPDLVVRWAERPATGLTHLDSDRFGTVRRHGGGSGRSGNHTPGDAWAVLAPGAGRLRQPSRPPRLVDIAATICEITGASAEGLPGEPLIER
jgi:predicted AlkP superfamily phosphohydrolase/phosphomutase